MAHLFHNQGRYKEAEPLYLRSLAIREKALGPGHPDVAQSLGNLAARYKAQGRYKEAEPFFRRALTIYEKKLRPDHPDIATTLNDMAGFYEKMGKKKEAAALRARGDVF
ncbi:MAG: tetratricopeptide repeat protein [Nitrospinota bacterium]